MNIALLQHLRDAAGAFVPLDGLGCDQNTLNAELEELERFGFLLERHPYQGVAYRGPAERLCPDQIEFALGTSRIGRRISVWNRVASTNDLAARAVGSVANEGLVVLAEEQTAGRGRRGRRWSAPPRSSILMSTLLFPSGSLAGIAWLTALGAVATAEVVTAWSGRPARIKWPNDVRVEGQKIAGILVERGSGAVIGIGLNANVADHELPDELRSRATSLQILTGALVDRSELARSLIQRLDHWYELVRAQGVRALNDPWRERSEHLGHWMRVRTPGGERRGILRDLDLQSGLLLDGSPGPLDRIPPHDVLELAPLAFAGRDESERSDGLSLVEDTDSP